jgi:hypothetical protein
MIKGIILALALLLTGQYLPMGSRPITSASCTGALVTSTQTFATSVPANTTGATLLVALMEGTATLSAPSDSHSNTWTPLTTYGTSAFFKFYYVTTPTVGASHTFTNNSGGGTVLYVAAFSGINGGFQTGTDAGSTTPSGATIQPGSITPSPACNLIVTGVVNGVGSLTFSVNDSFTVLQTQNTFAPSGSIAYLVDSGTTAINPTWTASAAGSDAGANIAAFKQ